MGTLYTHMRIVYISISTLLKADLGRNELERMCHSMNDQFTSGTSCFCHTRHEDRTTFATHAQTVSEQRCSVLLFFFRCSATALTGGVNLAE